MISNELDYIYAADWQNVIPKKTSPDLAFWWGMAHRIGHPVLELGCGLGRLSTFLAKSGCCSTGLDVSIPTLCEAKKIAQQADTYVDWVLSDLQTFELDRQFALIILANNSLCQFLNPQELERCLLQVRKHLWSEGRLIIEAVSPSAQLFAKQKGLHRSVMEYRDENWNGVEVPIEEREMRLYFNEEIESILERNGFFVEMCYGDFDASPYQEHSPKQILVCGLR